MEKEERGRSTYGLIHFVHTLRVLYRLKMYHGITAMSQEPLDLVEALECSL